MTVNYLRLKNTICIIIYIISTTSCCNKHVIDNINNQNTSNDKIKNYTNRQGITSTKNSSLKIHVLENINIIYFDLDQYNILTEFFKILKEHADFLCHNQYYKIIIEGHADERGTPEYNIALGERRAHSVKMYLQSLGVMDQQMYLISYGKEKLVSLGHKEEDHAKNRRVVIVYPVNN